MKFNRRNKVEIGKVLSLAVIGLGVIVLLSGVVSAEFWACFDKGQEIDYCNPAIPNKTCGNTNGCQYCMSEYDESRGCYNQGNFNTCNSVPQECSNMGPGGNDGGPAPEIDVSAPEFNLVSPVEGEVYTKRSINVNFNINEDADVYYMDNLKRAGRWNRLCSGCSSYSRKRGFNEGVNNLTFRFEDKKGNAGEFDVTFIIDSRKPKINKYEPRKGFASGRFDVQFREDNPDSLVLHYGNEATGWREHVVDIGSDCTSGRRGYSCGSIVNLTDYDGQDIEYWFELVDISGNTDTSRRTKLGVDTTFPEFEVDYTQDERRPSRIEITLTVDEENFEEATYEVVTDSRPRERRMCSRLRDGQCSKRISLRGEGYHIVKITVKDEAGNAIAKILEVTI